MGLSGIPVFKELFRLRSEITFPGKWKTWWRAGYYLWPPVAISCTHLLSGRSWGRGWLWVDTGRQLMNAMKFVPPAGVCGDPFLDFPLSRRGQKSQGWDRQQTSFMQRQKEKHREEVWVLSSQFAVKCLSVFLTSQCRQFP